MRLYTLLSQLPYSLLISSLALVVTAVPVESQEAELRVLTPEDFDSTIANGVWFIEHFSPYCGHCKRFAPTWAKLVEEVENQQDPGIHLAQVNCAVHGDLCSKNKVDAYPQMNLYRNGGYVDTFTKPRELELLLEYVSAHAEPTAKPTPPPITTSVSEPQDASVSIPPAKIYNPSGKVMSLDQKSFTDTIKEGHVFVKFFAPWCGHCKKLAPIWELLASEMRDKVNIAEVDCEDHAAICKSQGVTGYPMLFYYNGGGNEKTEYTGGRKLEQLKSFAEKVSGPPVQELRYEDLVSTVTDHPVVYLLLHRAPDTKALDEVSEASHALFGSPPVYASSSHSFYDHFNVQQSQAMVLAFKDHDYSAPAAVYSFPQYSYSTNQEDLRNWLLRNRLPTATELDADTFQEVMYADHKPLVVIVAAPPSNYAQVIEKVKDLSKNWKDSKGRGDVVFTWMDADKWGKWLKSMYGIKGDTTPQVVVANHSRLIYYEVDQLGEKIKLTPTSLFSVINGAYAGTIPYRHSENILERFARYMNKNLTVIEHVVSEHPWRVTFIVLATLGCLLFYLRRVIYRESALADEMSRKARLD